MHPIPHGCTYAYSNALSRNKRIGPTVYLYYYFTDLVIFDVTVRWLLEAMYPGLFTDL